MYSFIKDKDWFYFKKNLGISRNKKNMKNKICSIFNLAALYRQPIYELMDKELKCDFYITKWKVSPFKQMDYGILKGYKGSGRQIDLFKGFYWQTDTINKVFKPYKHYILSGEPHSISTWIVLLLAKLFGKKTYLWSHGWYGKEKKAKILLKKCFFKLSTKVFLYGDYARDLMIDEGFMPEKLICIYNSLDYKKQIKIRESLNESKVYSNHFNNDFPVLIYIGRIQKVKKLEMILNAIKVLNTEGCFCNLVLVGNDSEGLNLEGVSEKIGINEQVWIYGACYSEEILGELIYNSSICVSPGNIGLTAMHSLVYGTPIITHNNFKNQMPEFEAINKGVSGDFFNENSLTDLVSKIKLWVSKDIKLREDTRKHCYKVIDEKYNPQVQIEILKKTILD